MKMVEFHFAIFSLRMERHTEMNWASITNFAPAIQGIISQFVAAGGIFAMGPHAARMSRVRAAEKDAQRRAEREASISSAVRLDDSPVIIRFPRETTEWRVIDPALRARRREKRLTVQKLEADRVASAMAVRTAAEAFIRAIRHSTAMLAALEEDGLDPGRFLPVPWSSRRLSQRLFLALTPMGAFLLFTCGATSPYGDMSAALGRWRDLPALSAPPSSTRF
jgi:hypothetical protein